MSDKQKKRYYWLKLKEDFFEEDTIEWLEEQPNGKEYCLFYLKLCLKSLKTEGLLVRNVGNMMIPYDPESLAKLTNSSADTVKVAMDLFQKIGLIQMLDDGEIYINQLNELVGSETEAAKQKRLQRAKDNQRTLSEQSPDKLENTVLKVETENPCEAHEINNSQSLGQCPRDVHQSIEYRDIEKELEKELDVEERQQPSIYPAELIQTLYGRFPTGILQSSISGWMKEWSREMVCFAIQTSYDYGKELDALKPYINRIFENWKLTNIDTLEKAVKAASDFKKRQKSPQRQPIRKETIPDHIANPVVESQEIDSGMQSEIEARLERLKAREQKLEEDDHE